MILGTMPKPMTVEEIRTEVAKSQPDLEAYDLEVLSADKDLTYLTAVCLKSDAAKLEDALRGSRVCKTVADIRQDSVPVENRTGGGGLKN